jgi:diguanylate cyclase (GGDEF)-like protein
MGKMEYLAQSTTNMILNLSDASSLEECFKAIEDNARIDTGFEDFLMCLTPDWDKQKVINDSTVIKNEKMLVVAGFRGDKSVPRQTFNLKDILPKDMMDDPNPYYIFSIHHLQYFMGYIIVSPVLKNYNQLIMKSWLVNLGAMLENWRIRKELNYTVERLQNLYVTDMLTGLYNRRGYGLHFENYYKECRESDTNLAVFLIDMDNMKQINDTYGHDEGDYCLCTIGKALKAAKKADEICVRSGGDEFVVLAKNYTEEDRDTYIVKVREFLEESCREDQKAFDISVSIGCYMAKPDESEVAISEISERYLRKADRLMYAEKKEHKKQKLNND